MPLLGGVSIDSCEHNEPRWMALVTLVISAGTPHSVSMIPWTPIAIKSCKHLPADPLVTCHRTKLHGAHPAGICQKPA